MEILVGEDTYKGAPEFAMLEMDLIRVKGKTKPVHIYALMGDEELTKNLAFKSLKEQHEAMIAAYQSGDFKAASEALKSCVKLDNFDLEDVYGLYRKRLDALIAYPPEEDWDGVFDALTK